MEKQKILQGFFFFFFAFGVAVFKMKLLVLTRHGDSFIIVFVHFDGNMDIIFILKAYCCILLEIIFSVICLHALHNKIYHCTANESSYFLYLPAWL